MAILQDRIKERRNALGLTLLEIAEQLNVTEATMQRYENGQIKNIKHETIYALSQILNCSPSYLMGWSNSISEKPTVDNGKLSDRQKRIVELFNDLTDEQQDNLIGRAEMLAELNEQEYKKQENA
jgi:transcriptional regulator with XRE-family HTH domain